jgi:hypothetical protein
LLRGRRRLFFYEETVGGELAAAEMGDHGELAGFGQSPENLLDAASTETREALQGGLVGGPLAVLVGEEGYGEEDEAAGSSLEGVLQDVVGVLTAHGQEIRELALLLEGTPEGSGGVGDGESVMGGSAWSSPSPFTSCCAKKSKRTKHA